MSKVYYTVLVLFISLHAFAQPSPKTLTLEKGEQWYGAAVSSGTSMPFKDGTTFELNNDNHGNQCQPLLLSSTGRYIWSNDPFKFTINGTELTISNNHSEIIVGKAGNSLGDAYREACKKFFAATGQAPDPILWQKPQYNTWIELVYNQNQVDILKYAQGIIDNGFPPGVLMIDDNWADYYGKFSFRKDRFPDAKAMIAQLHKMGFKVMVWVCPFVSPDVVEFRDLMAKKLVAMDNEGDANMPWDKAKKPLIVNWWNGYSAQVDFTNPDAVAWYKKQLDYMVTEYGVDGFKLDAGDMQFYPPNLLSFKKVTPNEQSELWGQFGLLYPLNEYRAMWKRGGQPLAERLGDKHHDWHDVGRLIPDVTAAGLIGYPFACPDMIGGGDYLSFIDNPALDQDLIVRSAQVHALMPMMQFSLAPWRVLDKPHMDAIKAAVATRMKYTPYIDELFKHAAQTAEPIARRMEYVFPHQGFEKTIDQFMLGDKYLVAPIVKKAPSRSVMLPKGTWKGDDGKTYKGGKSIQIEVALNRIPVFERVK
ncbi:glycoside hydrolase [Mucilaginibacter terrigena]|uniref:Glycoside hydrolase n=1 Tax=Mucilaginibacter terrigena TaxID=2492395 RepID=A0A4Q5LLD4_9SPHI|nr:glycoside hydrolase family 31 protein [Mucilaginibacter terrigena]RYU90448.1 glycoside hydrolase [Mucilaginibacter terrigena]